jgi:hypothetical protein
MEEQRTLFISSCSRREWARRRPQRSVWRAQFIWAMALAASVVSVLALRGSF